MPKDVGDDGTGAATTVYEVRNTVSGEMVCRCESMGDARREQRRLEREAALGVTVDGQALSQDGGPVKHNGRPVRFEVVTVSGVVLG